MNKKLLVLFTVHFTDVGQADAILVQTLARLKKAGIETLRTDQLGTIIITTDGTDKLEIYTHAAENDGG